MKIKSAVFKVSAPDFPSCPASALPEFAFIGRSNVGKSSLINLLTERRDLANVSDTPGKTKLINFFLVNNAWHLVDLPGYGYAHVSKTEHEGFQRVIVDYLERRDHIACVFVLIDSRLPPQAIDREFVDWLGGGPAPFALVFTKADKQSAGATQKNIDLFLKSMTWRRAAPRKILTTSATTKTGRTELLNFIGETLTGPAHA